MTRPPIRALLIDLSGTLHVGTTPTPAAVHALARLRASQIPFRFCSNTSKQSTASLHTSLAAIGFNVKPEELWTSIGAVRRVLDALAITRPYIIASDSAREELQPETTSQGEPLDPDTPYDAVVLAFAPAQLDYSTLNAAFRILASEHHQSSPQIGRPVPLIATHRSLTLQDADARLSLGPGPFISALESASRTTAHVVGKPSRAFFQAVIDSLSLPDADNNGKIAIIGDDVESDLGGGAKELGLWRVLVRTGKYRPGSESRAGVDPPDEVADSFAAFVDSLLGPVN
ncbi:HAD-like domain-containing protein [Amylostereum chailletii]|nr:HAD-like domain-containing protein [Amylostereum chailletii]